MWALCTSCRVICVCVFLFHVVMIQYVDCRELYYMFIIAVVNICLRTISVQHVWHIVGIYSINSVY